MCGRYYIDEETMGEIERLVRHLDQALKNCGRQDVFPSRKAPCIAGTFDEFAAELYTWGFPRFDGKGLLINARSESALEKRTFRDSVKSRRCIIPAAGFYEWNEKKEKYAFTRPNGATCYLAGIYKEFGGIRHFVILTTQANSSAESVHSRMPLVLDEKELEAWIFDAGQTEAILHKIPPALLKQADYEQQTLPL